MSGGPREVVPSDPVETSCEFCGEECKANRLNWAVWSSGGARPILVRLHHACMGDYVRKRSAEGWK